MFLIRLEGFPFLDEVVDVGEPKLHIRSHTEPVLDFFCHKILNK